MRQFLKTPFNGTAYLFEILVQNAVKLLRKFTICEECHWAMRHYVCCRRLNGGHVQTWSKIVGRRTMHSATR
jgi:hypothetical protein